MNSVPRTDLKELIDYLAVLRTQVAKHGRNQVDYKPEGNTKIGFRSPEGWWLISVEVVRMTCVEEVGQKRLYRNRKATVAGNYARRDSPEGIFIDWFSEKMQTAINEGERLRANHGLS